MEAFVSFVKIETKDPINKVEDLKELTNLDVIQLFFFINYHVMKYFCLIRRRNGILLVISNPSIPMNTRRSEKLLRTLKRTANFTQEKET